MKNIKKGALICWIIAVLFFLCSFTFIGKGEYVNLAVGIVIAAVLGFVGYRMQTKPATAKQAPVSSSNDQAASPFEYQHFKIAGVTFDNDDGVNRQALLKKIKNGTPPYDGTIEYSITRYDYEGRDAYAISANGAMLGNVPADFTSFITENFSRIVAISYVSVYGGRGGHSFGAEVTIRLNK